MYFDNASINEIKRNIGKIIDNDARMIVIQGSRNRNQTLYKICIALTQCLKEQIDTNKQLLSNQESMYQTNDVLIKRITDALNKLNEYDTSTKSLNDDCKHNYNIVRDTYRILNGG